MKTHIVLIIQRILKAVLPESVYLKLRKWYLQKNIPVRSANQSACAQEKGAALLFGVNLFAYDMANSAGSETHLLRKALEAGNIPYQVINLSDPNIFAVELEEKLIYRYNLIVCHAASETPNRIRRLRIDLDRHFNIGYWAWELPIVPDQYCEGLEIFQEIWTLSGFCTSALEKKARMPVLTIPLYANPERSILENGREYFRLDENAFLFVFAFDCNSFVSRKNPQAVVKAFIKAFSPDDNVGLILKAAYPERVKNIMDDMLEEMERFPQIYYIDKYLSPEELRTLLHASNAFISLHRSEGFGLLPLEAMSLGTPVVATEWSGNLEYMNHMNAALVGYELVPVNGEYVGSAPGDEQTWAEANVEEAAKYMRRMVEDTVWRESLIAKGKETANMYFSDAAIGRMMRERLQFLV